MSRAAAAALAGGSLEALVVVDDLRRILQGSDLLLQLRLQVGHADRTGTTRQLLTRHAYYYVDHFSLPCVTESADGRSLDITKLEQRHSALRRTVQTTTNVAT